MGGSGRFLVVFGGKERQLDEDEREEMNGKRENEGKFWVMIKKNNKQREPYEAGEISFHSPLTKNANKTKQGSSMVNRLKISYK